MIKFTSLLLHFALFATSSHPSPFHVRKKASTNSVVYFQHKSNSSHRRQQGNCPAGSFAEAPESSCEPCPAGTFAGRTGCLACPSGFYQDQPGRFTCIGCKTEIYDGEGSNAAIVVDSERHCLLAERDTPSLQPSTNPSTTTPSSISITSDEPSFIIENESVLPFTPPSQSPSFLIENENILPSITVSLSPTVAANDADDSTVVSISNSSMLVCTNNTFALHGQCSDCVLRNYSLFNLLAFVMMFILLMISFRAVSPSYIFLCMAYLQSMGMLSLVKNVEWPVLVINALQHIQYWAGLDWAAIVAPDCLWGTLTSRLVVTSLPVALATLPLGVSNVCLKRYETFITYYSTWSSLGLLLAIPSVLVTMGEAVLCDGDYFCASNDSWWPLLVPPLAIIFCVAHFIWLAMSISQERHLRDSILQSIYRYWWWPYEILVLRVIQVSCLFFYDGIHCLILFAGVDLCSVILHLALSPWTNPPPSHTNAILCFCLVAFSLMGTVLSSIGGEHYESDLTAFLGVIVLLLVSGSIIMGLMRACDRHVPAEVSVVRESYSMHDDPEEQSKRSNAFSTAEVEDNLSIGPGLVANFGTELPSSKGVNTFDTSNSFQEEHAKGVNPFDTSNSFQEEHARVSQDSMDDSMDRIAGSQAVNPFGSSSSVQEHEETIANAVPLPASAPPIGILYDQTFSLSDQSLLVHKY